MKLNLVRRNALYALFSIIVVLYAEWHYPSKVLSECKWPLGPTASHVALIADPQLVDKHMYPKRNRVLLWITEYISDLFMARNFRLIHKIMKPDHIFFLGDLFDGGREWGDEQWNEEFGRWQKVFPLSFTIPHYQNLPGNHDVGSEEDIVPWAMQRFQDAFGPANQEFVIANQHIITLDTNSMLSNNETMKRPVEDFFEKIASERAQHDPLIVLTHIPLYRKEDSYCGFERETLPFSWVKGIQYITEVHPDVTDRILAELRPAMIFSGDDHDACKYTHQYQIGDDFFGAEENTVKSFSMNTKIKRPGFQLLSLDTHKRQETELCLVGEPFWPFILQGVAFTALFVVMLLIHATAVLGQRSRSYLPVSVSLGKPVPNTRAAARANSSLLYGILTSFGGWAFGQFIVHWWSYARI